MSNNKYPRLKDLDSSDKDIQTESSLDSAEQTQAESTNNELPHTDEQNEAFNEAISQKLDQKDNFYSNEAKRIQRQNEANLAQIQEQNEDKAESKSVFWILLVVIFGLVLVKIQSGKQKQAKNEPKTSQNPLNSDVVSNSSGEGSGNVSGDFESQIIIAGGQNE